jgi:hypothetical protein
VRLVFQILLFIFIAPICVVFGALGGCLTGAVTTSAAPELLKGWVMFCWAGLGLVGGLVTAALVVRSIRLG